ncbi:MAG: phosphoribosyltransferase [Patescibacteria group bacterium]
MAIRTEHGRLQTPLVGYAGRDDLDRQLVGDIYANFAKVERWPQLVRSHAALPLQKALEESGLGLHLVCCGAPEGGKMLASHLGAATGCEYVHPEKIVLKPKTETSREKSELRFTGRHELFMGSRVLIVEDVCNNFSTTAQLIDEIESRGCEVVGIACVLNRSPTYRSEFLQGSRRWPVLSLWNEPFPEYQQDDPHVADDIAAGNIVWKPKEEWERLKERADPYAFL